MGAFPNSTSTTIAADVRSRARSPPSSGPPQRALTLLAPGCPGRASVLRLGTELFLDLPFEPLHDLFWLRLGPILPAMLADQLHGDLQSRRRAVLVCFVLRCGLYLHPRAATLVTHLPTPPKVGAQSCRAHAQMLCSKQRCFFLHYGVIWGYMGAILGLY